MPLDIALPWLKAPDLVGAASEGAQAGLGAARIAQAGQEASQHLALQAEQMHQQNQQEGARLSQQEHIAQMEAQTRQEISQQNQLRESQKLAIDQAYQTAQIGMAKGRLEQQQAVAAAKAKEAAASFQREQAFSSDVASGMSVMDAYKRNPVSASLLSGFIRETKPDKPQLPKDFNTRDGIVRVNPDGSTKVLHASTKAAADESILGAAGDAGAGSDSGSMWGGIGMIRNKLFGSSPAPAKRPAPKPGDVLHGHTFKGGDPSDPDSWESVSEGE